MSVFDMSYTFLGGLGIFFIGMHMLSESLQTIAGDLIRRIINALTSHRLMAVLVGAGVTMLIQSSSVTTVMVIGFVNAGLMELTQAIGVIFGANIGTTITGWIIAIKIGKYGLLLIGLGALPRMFAKRRKTKAAGSVLVGLGFVFFGLESMSAAFKPLRTSETFLSLLNYFAADTFLTVYACIAVGMVLTFVVQSSSAMLGITIALAVPGTITFQTAVALVLGQNIGTTITAILASVGTNSTARQAARAHAIFNVAGAVLFSLFFWHFLDIVDLMVVGEADAMLEDGSKPHIATHIAAAHTLFNVVTTLLFIPLLTPLARLVVWMTPTPRSKEIPHLQHLPSVSWSSPALAMVAASKELENLARVCLKMLTMARDFAVSKDANEDALEEIHRLEGVTDAIQAELTVYVCKIQENKLTEDQSAEAYAMIRCADELESIGDYCEAICKYRANLQKKGESFSEEAIAEYTGLFEKTIAFYREVYGSMTSATQFDFTAFYAHGDALTKKANTLRTSHRKRLEEGRSSAISGMFYNDMVVALRKIRAHTVNFAQALYRVDI